MTTNRSCITDAERLDRLESLVLAIGNAFTGHLHSQERYANGAIDLVGYRGSSDLKPLRDALAELRDSSSCMED